MQINKKTFKFIIKYFKKKNFHRAISDKKLYELFQKIYLSDNAYSIFSVKFGNFVADLLELKILTDDRKWYIVNKSLINYYGKLLENE